MVEQAKIKNNPTILAHKSTPSTDSPAHTPRRTPRRALKTDVKPSPVSPSSAPVRVPAPQGETNTKFHQRHGHEITECKAFSAKPVKERTNWILQAGLCFFCLNSSHVARDCQQKVKCTVCGDGRHNALFHVDKRDPPPDKDVNAKCSAACSTSKGGVSCGKIVPVDVFPAWSPELAWRVYAILDEQSNSSLNRSELADELGINAPPEKYFLSTCSGRKEVKYGRRATGLSVRSLSGLVTDLPTLIECDSIPQDKCVIPTPEMAKRLPHLADLATEIPSLDTSTELRKDC